MAVTSVKKSRSNTPSENLKPIVEKLERLAKEKPREFLAVGDFIDQMLEADSDVRTLPFSHLSVDERDQIDRIAYALRELCEFIDDDKDSVPFSIIELVTRESEGLMRVLHDRFLAHQDIIADQILKELHASRKGGAE